MIKSIRSETAIVLFMNVYDFHGITLLRFEYDVTVPAIIKIYNYTFDRQTLRNNIMKR